MKYYRGFLNKINHDFVTIIKVQAENNKGIEQDFYGLTEKRLLGIYYYYKVTIVKDEPFNLV